MVILYTGVCVYKRLGWGERSSNEIMRTNSFLKQREIERTCNYYLSLDKPLHGAKNLIKDHSKKLNNKNEFTVKTNKHPALHLNN